MMLRARCRGVGRPEIRGVCEEETGESRVSVSNGCTICLLLGQVKTRNERAWTHQLIPGTAGAPQNRSSDWLGPRAPRGTAQVIGWDRVYEAGCGVKTNFE